MKELGFVDALEAWHEAGRRLSEVDRENFTKMLALARAYVAVHDRELEDAAVFESRIAEITHGSSKASA